MLLGQANHAHRKGAGGLAHVAQTLTLHVHHLAIGRGGFPHHLGNILGGGDVIGHHGAHGHHLVGDAIHHGGGVIVDELVALVDGGTPHMHGEAEGQAVAGVFLGGDAMLYVVRNNDGQVRLCRRGGHGNGSQQGQRQQKRQRFFDMLH